MTSNFSEAGKMTVESEIAAYQELVGDGCASVLVLKPHPRDSREKIQSLRNVLAARFQKMIVLDDPQSFYLPFESVFDRFLFTGVREGDRPQVLCTSSACLAFELVYGISCRLGFGEQAVPKYFRQAWIPHRLRHERDLQEVVSEIRGRRCQIAA
jgi:hypothetical protein